MAELDLDSILKNAVPRIFRAVLWGSLTFLAVYYLPILFYPIVMPLLILAVSATGDVFDGESWGSVSSYLGMMVGFDVVFTTVSVLVFEYVLEE